MNFFLVNCTEKEASTDSLLSIRRDLEILTVLFDYRKFDCIVPKYEPLMLI